MYYDNLAHHHHVAFLFLDSLSRVHVTQHGCFMTGAVLVPECDSCSYFVIMGLSWGGPGVKVHLMSLKQIHPLTFTRNLHEMTNVLPRNRG